jgi:hypothetical protein
LNCVELTLAKTDGNNKEPGKWMKMAGIDHDLLGDERLTRERRIEASDRRHGVNRR